MSRFFQFKRFPSFRTFLFLLGTLAVIGIVLINQSKLNARSISPSSGNSVSIAPWKGEVPAHWKAVEKLINEQKFEAANEEAEKLLEKAVKNNDQEDWARGLIRITQLRMALHGYETAVENLKNNKWPEDPSQNILLRLFYAETLTTYARAYSWEIQQREKMATQEKGNLRTWTMEQIYTEANQAYFGVWQYRDSLARLSKDTFKEFISPNSFPEGIRSSMRDVVTYLWVNHLSDTAGWNPDQTNEIYRLNLQDLLRSSELKENQFVDPNVHPLKKIAAVLQELETANKKEKQPESAFEARRVLLEHLHQNFTNEEDRASIKEDLESHLRKIRSHPWWAFGVATLVEFTQAESTDDNLIRAREIALKGAEKYPDSPGGQKCRALAERILLPELQLTGMAIDGLNRNTLGLDYKNVEKVYFRAWKFDLKKQIESADDYNLYPTNRELEKILSNKKPDVVWSEQLKATVDYKTHRRFITPPIKNPGAYLVAVSLKEDFPKENNLMKGVNLIISDIVLMTQKESDRVVVHAVSGKTGASLSNVRVSLYDYNWQKGHRVFKKETTGADGKAEFVVPSRHANNCFLFAEKGDEVSLEAEYLYFSQKPTLKVHPATFLYTDRSIYRPGQKIKFKAVLYSGDGESGNFKTTPNQSLTVRLLDGNYQEVLKAELTTNKFGTASGEFVIPRDRVLGHWQLQSLSNGSITIRVEEYKRPTFELTLESPKTELRLNKKAALTGNAKYYFGLPVTEGTVKWSVSRTPIYPRFWYYCWWWYRVPPAQSQIVEFGESAIDEKGAFAINFLPQADSRMEKNQNGLKYRYQISAELTNAGGETQTSEKTITLGFVSVDAQLNPSAGFFIEGEKGAITVLRTNTNGEPAPGEGQFKITSLQPTQTVSAPADYPYLTIDSGSKNENRYVHPDDQKRKRWESQYNPDVLIKQWTNQELKEKGNVDHDAEGKADIALPKLPAGYYRVIYTTKDSFGKELEETLEFLVAGKNTHAALPGVLKTEKQSVSVGETLRFTAFTAHPDQTLYVIAARNGKEIFSQKLTNQSESLFEIPVTEELRGGFGIALYSSLDHNQILFQQQVFVPWDNKDISLSYSTFRDLLRPGSKEKWVVKVTGPGKDQSAVKAAELLAYMYDRSLDAFAPHNPISPGSAYRSFSSGFAFGSNLGTAPSSYIYAYGISHPTYSNFTEDRLNFLSGYGIGGVGYRQRFAGSKMHRGLAERRMMAFDMAAAPVEKSSLAKNKKEDSKERKRNEQEVDNRRSDKDSFGDAGAVTQAPVTLRTNFSETAFWKPHLITNADGSASIEFTVPDSLTSWNVWVHAVTSDLKFGSLKKEVKTQKDLMVRPYLPRFLREGDVANVRVMVNNASSAPITGQLQFDIQDPQSGESILDQFSLRKENALQSFTVKEKGSQIFVFTLKTPSRLGEAAILVTAKSAEFTDGEKRPLPVLPGRMHLFESKFVVLKDNETRRVKFDSLANDNDPTRINQQMVVTVDGQLFMSALSALPYLVNYPYECTEQTLNRYLATGILTSMFDAVPSLKKMAADMANRSTQFEQWDQPDPNRKISLEETPWLQMAQGGTAKEDELLKILNPSIAKAQLNVALKKLKKIQTSSGGYPWFPGGPPSPYMTLYTLYGYSKGLEFGVDAPKAEIQEAWQYLHRYYINEIAMHMTKHDHGWHFVTFLNYVLSNYPDVSWTNGVFNDDERKAMLEFSFRHWKLHPPYLKGYLALTLHRMGRTKDAKLVWASVMDSAKTEKDKGTFWAPEDRGWLWYNDSIETHAFAIRTLMELDPKNEKLDGLVLWLFLNKKLNHWKSTRATSEVLYSLAHYLKMKNQFGVREQILVSVGPDQHQFTFEPDKYTGKKNQVVIPGEELKPAHSEITAEKKSPGYAFVSTTWHYSTEKMPDTGVGDFLTIERSYYKRDSKKGAATLTPLQKGDSVQVGDEIEIQISIKTGHPVEYVHLRDPRAAGLEPVSQVSQYKWDQGINWYEEIRDTSTNFFFENLPQGEYTFKYRVRAAMSGTFKSSPATLQPMYAPEFGAYSAGREIVIAD